MAQMSLIKDQLPDILTPDFSPLAEPWSNLENLISFVNLVFQPGNLNCDQMQEMMLFFYWVMFSKVRA